MQTSKIEWTRGDDGAAGASWNPIRGCTRVSRGCEHCYAEAIAARFSDPDLPFSGFAKQTPGGPRWTGKVELIPDKLAEPLRWRKPRRVFVNSMSDLFHESLSNEDIAAVFGVMAACERHTFQVLTKRPERMREWFRWVESTPDWEVHAHIVAWDRIGMHAAARGAFAPVRGRDLSDPPNRYIWPLTNVHLGVSCEDQATADERIPPLLDTPAAVRWVSAEPLLGPLDLTRLPYDPEGVVVASTLARAPVINALRGYISNGQRTGLDWVVVGGESGPGARPMHLDWPRSIVGQCVAAGVPVFFKQWGAWAPLWDADIQDERDHQTVKMGAVTMCRYGKKAAGRMLDGRTWDEMPAVAAQRQAV